MIKKFTYILFISFVISCQDIQPVKSPDNFIDQTEMEEILYEIAIVNAARGYDIQKLSKYGISPETYIFEKYNIDSLQFAENVTYYSSDIELYKEMYTTIQKRIEEDSKYYDSIARIEKKVKDSIRAVKAKELRREKDSIRKIDSTLNKKNNLKKSNLKEVKEKSRLPVRVSKEIFIDSL